MTPATATKEKTLKAVADEEVAAVDAEVQSKPGEQGIATQEEDEGQAHGVWDRAPSQMEINLAEDSYEALRDASNLTPEQTVDHLIRCVDVYPRLRMPETWPGESDEVLRESSYLGEIGRILSRGCRSKIEAPGSKIIFLWRNKKSWTKSGVPVRARARTLSETERFLTDGCVAEVAANFQLFRYMNTRQRIAAVYHALRSLDKDGKKIPPQFTGWFDELALFGTGTFKDDANLIRAIEQGAGRELPWTVQPSLFDMEDEAEDAVEEAKAA